MKGRNQGIRNWSLRTKLLVPVILVIFIGSLGILRPIIAVQNRFVDVQIPREDLIELIGLKTTELNGETREFVAEGRPGTMEEIQKIEEDLAASMEEMHRLSGDPESLDLFKQLVQNFEEIARRTVRLQTKINLSKDDLVDRCDSFCQTFSKQNAESECQALKRQLQWYLSQTLFIKYETSGTEQSATLRQTLETYITAFNARLGPEERTRLDIYLKDIHKDINQALIHEKSLEETLEELEDVEQETRKSLSIIRQITLKEIEEEMANGLSTVSLTIALVLAALFAFIWFFAQKLSRDLADLGTATKRLSENNLDVRLAVNHGDELGKVMKAFNLMAERLKRNTLARQKAETELLRQERLAALGKLTGTVSHELRNPLGTIKTSAAVIRKLCQRTNPMLDTSLELLDRNINRCNKIIGDLLTFTRIHKPERKPIEIDPWLQQVILEFSFSEKVDVNFDLQSAIVSPIDQEQMRRAVINLIENAIQAMIGEPNQPRSGAHCLLVSTSIYNNQLALSIRDNGPGIDTESLKEIFEPLYSTKSFGVGLGLPTVKQIVEEHGGNVEVNSKVNEGTQFILWLPLEENAGVRP